MLDERCDEQLWYANARLISLARLSCAGWQEARFDCEQSGFRGAMLSWLLHVFSYKREARERYSRSQLGIVPTEKVIR
jgi:hypothetical protein